MLTKMANRREKIPLSNQIETGFRLLNLYSWLLDSYLLDFFTESHINKLPNSWKEFIDAVPLDQFHAIINLSENLNTCVYPLSIMCIRVLIESLTLSRKIKESESGVCAQNVINNKIDNSKTNIHKKNENSFVLFTHPKLWNLFLKHVKPKKRYEILKMAEVTYTTAKKLNVEFIVDVGSGLGHLSRVLAYGYNLKVCSVETQSLLIKQAQKLDSEFVKTASKYLSSLEAEKLKNKSPVYMNETIKVTLKEDKFLKDLRAGFFINDNHFRFGIVGLHPCGDLAGILLKLYSTWSEAQFINVVGCCYHKLTTTHDNIKMNYGFPLSNYCMKNFTGISYEAKALACHAIETYCERIKSRNFDHLKVHCYRAVLEKIIHNNWPQFKKHPLSNVKSGPNVDFMMYCKKALKKLGLSVPIKDFYSQDTQNNLSQWQDVVKFYSLRLMFAPLIETVILLDRMMYLSEKDTSCEIATIFDPLLSPRNLVLLSEKSF